MKLEDQTIINSDDLNVCQCSVCNAVLEFSKDSDGDLTSTHCDKNYVLSIKSFVANVTKNQNKVKVIERKHLDHPDKETNSKRYI